MFQCGALLYSVVQCDTMWYSVVQCGTVRRSAMQCDAVCCSVLQRVAVCCSVLQCVAVHFISTLEGVTFRNLFGGLPGQYFSQGSVLQCNAAVLQCVAAWYNALQ